MYNQHRQWEEESGAGYRPFHRGPPPLARPPPMPTLNDYGSHPELTHLNQVYGRHPANPHMDPPHMEYRGGAQGRDPGAQFGSRYERDYGDDRRERPRRRSRSRSPASRGIRDNREGREWDRGKPRSSGRYSPPPRGGERDDDYRDHDRSRDRKPFQDDPPSKTVMLRNLPGNCFEAEIRHVLGPDLGGFADIRVPRNPEGGNRGFGFIEFPDIPTAVSWMEQIQGALIVNDQRVVARFSESRDLPFKKREDRDSRPAAAMLPADWECARCGCNNFRHRNTCFRCEAARNEAEIVNIPSADDQVGLSPCSTLLLRNLDTQTDEAKITSALTAVMGNVPLKAVKTVKDPRTNQSVGYGFALFRSVSEATDVYNCLMRTNPPLTIDGKQVSVSFAKNGLNENPQPVSLNSVTSSSSGVGGASARIPQATGYDPGNNANSAAAVAQLALQQMQKTQMSANVVHSSIAAMQNPAAFSMPGYQFDPTSGLYFSASSNMYYDPKTQYFYNPDTQQYLMWNAHTRQYVQVVAPAMSVPPAASQVPAPSIEPPVKPVEKKPKPEDEKRKQAEKIVQEMEKWAKAMNQKQPQSAKKAPPPESAMKIGVVASVFKDDDGDDPDETAIGTKLSYKSISIPSKSTSVAAPAPEIAEKSVPAVPDLRDPSRSPPISSVLPEDSAGLTDHLDAEKKLVDWDRFICLLCKRQLQTKDGLQKHLEQSPLHLRNLEAWRKEHMSAEEIEEMEAHEREAKYRDRAKERRMKHGEVEPAVPFPRDRAPSSSDKTDRKRPVERASVSDDEDVSGPAPGLGSDNRGLKLMKRLGWSEGKGLGKSKQGIIDPVEARGHTGTAGLGSSEGAPDILPNDSYANKVRKTMRQRFNQMQE